MMRLASGSLNNRSPPSACWPPCPLRAKSPKVLPRLVSRTGRQSRPGASLPVTIVSLDNQFLHGEPSYVELINVELAELAQFDRQATDAKPADRQKAYGEGADRGRADRHRSDRYRSPGSWWQRLSLLCSLHP